VKNELLQSALYKISQISNSGVTLDELYHSIHSYIGEIIDARNFYIALYDRQNDMISFPYFVDDVDHFSGPYKARKGLTEYVIRTGKPLLVDQAQHQELIKAGKVDLIGKPCKIWLGVPLKSQNEVIGVLTVQSYSDLNAYSLKDQEMLVFVSDNITSAIETKQAEESIKNSHDMLKESQRMTHLGSFEWDILNDKVIWSEELYRIFGIKPDQFKATLHSFYKLVHPEDLEFVKKTIKEGFKKKEPYAMTFRIVLPNDDERILRANGQLRFDDRGKPIKSIGTVLDVTESKKIEKILYENEELLKAIIDSTGDGILVVNKAGKVIHTNDMFSEIWKIPPQLLKLKDDDKLLNYVLSQLKDPDHFLSKVRDLYQSTKEDLDVIYFKNGRIIERFSKPLIFANKLEGRVWSFRDITKRKKAEEDLKTKNQELELFMYKASHNFKGPAASIRGLVDLTKRGVEDHRTKKYLDLIEDSTLSLERTLDSLLEVIKVKQGHIKVQKIDFKEILEEIINSLKYLSGFDKIKLMTSITVKTKFYSDKNLILCIFQNIIENAVKYRNYKRNSFIQISVEDFEKRFLKIEISDNGLGIPKDLIQEIFTMFFRANEFSKGVGLGLYLVKNALDKLGGTIKVNSIIRQKTTFTILMPNLK